MHESTIENIFIELLQSQGYEYHYGPDISPTGENPQREGWNSVILEQELKDSLKRLNPDLPESTRHEAYQKILNLGSQDIMMNNEKFHHYLTDGLAVEYFHNGKTTGVAVQLLDLENIENNNFWVVNQFVIKENTTEKRLDVVLFVNGLPLVVVELKNAIDEKATLKRAYTQIQNYKKAVPSIFYYNALCIISDGIDARTSSVSAPFSRYLAWKAPSTSNSSKEEQKQERKEIITEMDQLTKYMLEKKTLLSLIRYTTVFEKEEEQDKKTGLTSLVTIKKVAAYHQYYAVQKAIQQTLRATHEEGNRKIGIIWHTQGSGKSLSMVFYAGQLVTHKEMMNPTILVITDRNDLDDQLFTTFGNCSQLLRQTPVQAKNREHLKTLLQVAGGGIVFSTIQKFSPEERNSYETLSERKNIVVIADEAHRSQYGFKGKVQLTEK